MADPLWQREALSHHASLRVLGRRLELRSTGAQGLALATARFGRSRDLADGPPAIRLDIVLPPGGRSARPGSVPDGPIVDHPAMHRERDARYVAHAGPSLVLADLAKREICAFVDPSTPAPVLDEVILASPVWRCLAWEGMVALHAATIRLRGRSLVLVGGSGAGKSTLALAAALAGAQVLAEEVTWLDDRAGEPVLRGEPWRIGLLPTSFALLPQQASTGVATLTSAGAKTQVDLEALVPESCIEVCPIGPLIFLERQRREGPEDVTPLSAASARLRFEAGLGVGERSQRAERLEAACERLGRQGAYRLRFRRPSVALALLEALT